MSRQTDRQMGGQIDRISPQTPGLCRLSEPLPKKKQGIKSYSLFQDHDDFFWRFKDVSKEQQAMVMERIHDFHLVLNRIASLLRGAA